MKLVCTCRTVCKDGRWRSRPAKEPCTLCAAAPKLYEALTDCIIAMINNVRDEAPFTAAIQKGDAALAQAKQAQP